MYDIAAISKIRDLMIARSSTLAVAESVTSGHLQAALSLADRASAFYQGGITVYNLGQKSRHLKVDPIRAMTCNCVSEQVAGEMALQVRMLFSSDWSIGITGYAAPMPELGIHDLFAFFAIALHDQIVYSGKIKADNIGALQVQLLYANTVLQELARQAARNSYEFTPRPTGS